MSYIIIGYTTRDICIMVTIINVKQTDGISSPYESMTDIDLFWLSEKYYESG